MVLLYPVLLIRGGSLAILARSRFHGLTAMGAVLLGPFFGVSFSLLAVSMTNTGVAQTLMSLTPVLILWPSRQIFGKKVSMQEIVGAVIAVAGASLFFV